MTHLGRDSKWMLLSWIFSAVGGVASLGPYICIYFVARELMLVRNDPSLAVSPVLTHYGWLAVRAVMLSFSFYGLSLLFSHMAAFRLMGRLRIRLLRHLETLPLSFHLAHPSGGVRKIIENNSEDTEKFVAHQLPDIVQAVTTPAAFLACMIWFDWRLCLACLVPTLAGFLILRTILKDYSRDHLAKYQEALAGMSTGAVEYVRGISVVKVFGQSLYAFTRFHDAILNYKKFVTAYALSMKNPMALFFTAVNSIFFFLVPAGILIYCMIQAPADRERFVLSFVFFMVFTPLMPFLLTRIGQVTSTKLICTQALDNIEEVLATPPMAEPLKPVIPKTYGICFEDVSFSYNKNGPKALDHVSFTAKQGEITAIVGPSGSGKTTVVNLIARFWNPDEGRIRAGGVDLVDIPCRKWMSGVGMVFQDPGLFTMSLADNVAFFTPGAGRGRIRKALVRAQCEDIIAKLPEGMDTLIGAGGAHLSYGEMQRIALARTLLQDTPVLLLDEITAFADPENEYRIQKALNILTRDKTVIMVAHRLSTVSSAHKILVMDRGRITARGRHGELMAQEGLYAKMVREYRAATTWKIEGHHHV